MCDIMLDADYPFDPTNRAYQKFLHLASEHFDITHWGHTTTGRPAMLTLVDVATRDAFSLTLIDTIGDRQPHVLLAVTTDATLSLHGPISGAATTAHYAAHLALHHPDVAATTPAALHHPSITTIDPSQWPTVPPDIAATAHAECADTSSVGVVLLDRDRAQLAVVGPFPTSDDAQA
ncbi:hypothetical protein [Micromonospora matsumotoense]|uniref:hypothetical protein n=1 Tax=Micromonospora matsumotoense TaxID=121616 RepID=UPI0033C3F7D5